MPNRALPHNARDMLPAAAGNRRLWPRRRTLKSGRILFNFSRSSMDVQIINVSKGGACLRLGIPWPCPKLFELEIPTPNSSTSRIIPCEVAWQRGVMIGARLRRE